MFPSEKELPQFEFGPRIGRGAFGEISAIRCLSDNQMYAFKAEPLTGKKKILHIEINFVKIMSNIPYFPMYHSHGRTSTHTWLAMELLGPSLAIVAKRMPNNRLSLSTGLRVASLVMKGLQKFHEFGFIHRDIKPSNILLRRCREYPIAIIDFGLSRSYIDRTTKKHLPPRTHPGFRGTTVYASPYAHMHQEMSRRDDLISWYYMILDLMNGPLPWKRHESGAEILHMKRRLPIGTLGAEITPQLEQIWTLISGMSYEDQPDYEQILKLLDEAIDENKIKWTDEWDWHPNILHMDGTDPIYIQNKRSSDHGSSITSDTPSIGDVEKAKSTNGLSNEPLLGHDKETTCCCCNVQ